jgi:hypothetical protein
MKISMEIFVFVFTLISMPMIIAILAIEDRIVRHVCLKEGRRYSVFWLFSQHWHWRIFRLSWFKEARDAGYFRQRLILYVAWWSVIVVVVVLHASGLVRSTSSRLIG